MTFAGVFRRLYGRGRRDEADRLLANWVAAAPGDGTRWGCQMLADYDRERYGACVAAVDRHMAFLPSRYDGDALLLRAKALARLGRFPEADATLAEVQVQYSVHSVGGVTAKARNEVELLIALLAGDEARAGRVFDHASTAELYASAELGPLLRSDRYAALRAKYPPPVAVAPPPRPAR